MKGLIHCLTTFLPHKPAARGSSCRLIFSCSSSLELHEKILNLQLNVIRRSWPRRSCSELATTRQEKLYDSVKSSQDQCENPPQASSPLDNLLLQSVILRAPVLATTCQEQLDHGVKSTQDVPDQCNQSEKHHPILVKLLAEELSIKEEEIGDFELCLADHVPAVCSVICIKTAS